MIIASAFLYIIICQRDKYLRNNIHLERSIVAFKKWPSAEQVVHYYLIKTTYDIISDHQMPDICRFHTATPHSLAIK